MYSNVNQKELLSGVGGTIREIANHMSSSGVTVEPYCKRGRGRIHLPETAYGIDLNTFSQGGSEFFTSRVSKSYLHFIPPADEAALDAMDKSFRRAMQSFSLANGFVPTSDFEVERNGQKMLIPAPYKQLQEAKEVCRTEYFAKRDEILSRWSVLQAEFEAGARQMLDDIKLPSVLKDNLLREFLSAAPTAESYKRSFEMDCHVKPFPTEAIIACLNPVVAADVRATLQETVLSTAILSIQQSIDDFWSKLMSGMRQYLAGHVIKKSITEGLDKLAHAMAWKNAFRNTLLTKLSDSLVGISAVNDQDHIANVIEDAVVYVYGYARQVHLELDFTKCPYTKDQLDDMLYVAQAQMRFPA